MGLYDLAVYLDRLAVLQLPEERAWRDAQSNSRIAVEFAKTPIFQESIAEAWHAMAGLYCFYLIAVSFQNLSWLQFPGIYIEVAREAADALEALKQANGILRTGDDKRLSPSLKGHGLQEAGDPQDMIGMQMSQKDAIQAHHACPSAHHLPLRALAAVEEHHLALAVYQNGGGISIWRGQRSGGSKKGHT
jgi:hypothetical protein